MVEVKVDPLRTEPVAVHTDARGSLYKVHPEAVSGEVYAVHTQSGESRGHHFHRKMGEWFTALTGVGIVVVEDPKSGVCRQESLVGQRVYVPAGFAHALFNTGTTELLVLACADGPHDPSDVFPHRVRDPQ